jgi:hypothetical protein
MMFMDNEKMKTETGIAKTDCRSSQRLRVGSLALAVLAVFILLVLAVPSVSAQTECSSAIKTCQENVDCPTGQVCKGCPSECALECQPIEGWAGLYKYGVCQPCATSAECVKKTFEKAGAPSAWFVIAIVACAIALLASGLVFAMGYAFDMRQIKQMGRAELLQAVASLVLIALLFGAEFSEYSLIELMETQTGMVTSAIYSPQEYQGRTEAGQLMKLNPFEVSYAFMRKLVDCTRNQYTRTYDISVIYEWVGNMQIQFSWKAPGPSIFKFIPMAGEIGRIPMMRQIQEKEVLADELTWLTILLHMQLAIMRFAETSMFTVFLPIGIILRAFPPTRGAGAVMMAIAIGLYIVYPLVYTLLAVSTPSVIESCNLYVNAERIEIKKECPISNTALVSGATQAQATATELESSMVMVESKTTQLRYVAYLYFLISLGAAFLFIRSISGILGADIGEIGRSMIKMM